MTTSGLLGKLFNLGQYTDALNSPHAAAEFWVAVGVVVCLAVAAIVVASSRRHASGPR
jgi:hypothetical protein